MSTSGVVDLLKLQMFTGGQASLWTILYMTLFEAVVGAMKVLLGFLKTYITDLFDVYIKKRVENRLPTIIDDTNEIFIEKHYDEKDVIDFHNDVVYAIIYYISNLHNVKKFTYKNLGYIINYKNPIEITKDIKFQLLQLAFHSCSNDVSNISFKLISEKGSQHIKSFISECLHNCILKLQNKLGDNYYYFDQFISNKKDKFTNPLPTDKIYFNKLKFTTSRTLHNVFFEKQNEVLNRVNFFMNNKEWYDNKGIPYTLGFLFHGEPGTGKTSCVKAIANITSRHIININLGEIKTKTQLNQIFFDDMINIIQKKDTKYEMENYKIPIDKRLYVFEDIDCINNNEIIMDRNNLPTKEKQKDVKNNESFDDNPSELDLSSLLNVFDGTLETPGRIMIITTNYPEKLDKALIRPGRIDMVIKFGKANQTIIKNMYNAFFDKNEPLDFFNSLPDYFWTPAEVSQILFRNFNNPENSLIELLKKEDQNTINYTPLTEKNYTLITDLPLNINNDIQTNNETSNNSNETSNNSNETSNNSNETSNEISNDLEKHLAQRQKESEQLKQRYNIPSNDFIFPSMIKLNTFDNYYSLDQTDSSNNLYTL